MDLSGEDKYMLYNLWLHMAQVAVLTADRSRNKFVADRVFAELAMVRVDELPVDDRFIEKWHAMIEEYIDYAYQPSFKSWLGEEGLPLPAWFREEWVSKDW